MTPVTHIAPIVITEVQRTTAIRQALYPRTCKACGKQYVPGDERLCGQCGGRA